MERDLHDDVRRRAEPVETEPLGVAREPKRPVADQAGAQQRCDLEIGVLLGQPEAEALVGDGVFGEPAVPVVAGELRPVAEILEVGEAVAAVSVGPAEPRHADAPPLPDDLGDDHVAEDERKLRVRQLAVDDVEIRAADRAGADAQ